MLKTEVVKKKIVVGMPNRELKGYVRKELNIGDRVELTKNNKVITVSSDGERVANVAPQIIMNSVPNKEDYFNGEFEKAYDLGRVDYPIIVGKLEEHISNNTIYIVEVEVVVEKELSVELGEQITPYLSEKETQERVEYLKRYNVPDGVIYQLLKSIQPIEKYKELEHLIPTLDNNMMYMDHHNFMQEALSYLMLDNNIMLKGDKAVGKNVMATTIAYLFRKPIATLSLNSDTSLSDLLGDKTLKDGAIEFQLEVLPRLAQVGGIVVLDEINTADPSLLTGLHTLLDRNRSIYVAGYGNIVADKDFRVIATQNPDYVGTGEMNEATASRFVPFVFPANESIAEILMQKVPTANKVIVERIDQVYKAVKRLVQEGEVSDRVIDLRGLIAALETITFFNLELRNTLERNIIDRTTDEDERMVLESVFDSLIA